MRRHGRADALVASKAKASRKSSAAPNRHPVPCGLTLDGLMIVHLLDCSHESREKGQAADDPEKKSSDCSKRGSPVPP
jgi:hypothetical protein